MHGKKDGMTCKPGCGCASCTGTYAAVGRVMLGLLFLISAYGFASNFTGTVGYITSLGFPFPMFATALAIFFKVVGALLIISGFHARVGALMLIVYTVIATVTGHPIWNPSGDMAADTTTMLMFWKNVSIIGGLLYVYAFGAGSYSLAYLNKKVCMCSGICPDCSAEGCDCADGCTCGNCEDCKVK